MLTCDYFYRCSKNGPKMTTKGGSWMTNMDGAHLKINRMQMNAWSAIHSLMLRSESYMPGMQRRPSEASVWPCGHTQVNLGECLLICGAGRHMKEQPPFSIFSLHQLVPVLRRQQNLVTINASPDSSILNQSSKTSKLLFLPNKGGVCESQNQQNIKRRSKTK